MPAPRFGLPAPTTNSTRRPACPNGGRTPGPGASSAAPASAYPGAGRGRPFTLVALLACGLLPAAADTPFVNDPEMGAPSSVREGRKWQEETSLRLPAWPKDGNLIEISVDGGDDRFTHSIDRASLSTGSDGVVRYTLVTESASGARNVSYEGLRCTPKGRYKTYAYGSGGSFSPTAIADEWREVDPRSGDPVHYDLWRHYLCVPRLFKPRATKDQVRMLRSGRVPGVENTDFLTN